MDNSKYLILSSYDDAYQAVGLGPLSYEKNKQYADHHGYAFQCNHEPLRSHYFFHKFFLLQEVLPKYDYVLWIDADAFLVNHSKKIQDFLTKDSQQIITISIDQTSLNTGVFIIKNCDNSMHMLDLIIREGPNVNNPFPDAYIMLELFKKYPNLVNYIKPQKLFNAYKYELYAHRLSPNPDGEFEQGLSYVLHFPGMPLQDRVNAYHKYNVKEMV
jgi:hypothetical protein